MQINPRADFFTKVYQENRWLGNESRSGQGSDLAFAKDLIAALPDLLRRYDVHHFLDVPCGDFNWMQRIDFGLTYYVGGDIVQEVIDSNNAHYATNRRRFVLIDIVKDDLPNADMIFVRDCFIHFSNELVRASLNNIIRSGIKYLCLTRYMNFAVRTAIFSAPKTGSTTNFAQSILSCHRMAFRRRWKCCPMVPRLTKKKLSRCGR